MNRQRIPRPSGMALIELIVTFAVIGVLVALLLPAVQSARETSRRASCQNNLRQIGLALHNYEASCGAFPPSKTAATRFHTNSCDEFETAVEDNPERCTAHQSWTASCLPFMEHAALAQRYRHEIPWSSLANRSAIATEVSMFVCPGAPQEDRFDFSFVRGAAAADYAPISQVEVATYADLFGVPDPGINARRGALAEYTPNPAKRISDGLSRTVLCAESSGRPTVFVAGQILHDRSSADGAGDEVLEADGRWITDDGIGWADPESTLSVGGAPTNGLGPVGPRMINANNLGEAYSFHPGTAMFLFANGTVRPLFDDVDPWVFVCLCTRAGGEVGDDD